MWVRITEDRDFGNMKTPLPEVRDEKMPHSIKSYTSQCMNSKLGRIQ